MRPSFPPLSPPKLGKFWWHFYNNWTVKYHNTLCHLALSDHCIPYTTGCFHLAKIREKLRSVIHIQLKREKLFPISIEFMWWYTHGTGIITVYVILTIISSKLWKKIAFCFFVGAAITHELSQKCSLWFHLDLDQERHQLMCSWICHHVLIQSN